MKTITCTLVILPLLLARCAPQFPTRYDRIENDRLRPLAFVFDNNGLAEAAPGDTVTLRAYFTGENVESIEWKMTSARLLNTMGVDAVLDTLPLSIVGDPVMYTDGETDSVLLDFVVPPDIVGQVYAGVETIGSLLPRDLADSLPDGVGAIRPADVLSMLDYMAAHVRIGNTASVESLLVTMGAGTAEAAGRLSMLLQVFTAQFTIMARVNGASRVQGTFSVRYNSVFNKVRPSVLVNHNPRIEWLGVYKVRGRNLMVFDPLTEADKIAAFFPLSEGDTVPIDTGFSYFLAADSGAASLDMGENLSGLREPERFYYDWFYRNDDPVPGVPQDSLMALVQVAGESTVRLLPPSDTRMRDFSAWVVTFDGKFGEKLRPVGFAFNHARGVFSFSEAFQRLTR